MSESEPENHVRGYLMAIRYALSHLVENANRSSGPLSPILEKYKHLIDPHLYKKVVDTPNVIIKRNKWTHQMPCDLTHKMATDKNLTARCKDLSLSAEKFVKLFNELQHEGQMSKKKLIIRLWLVQVQFNGTVEARRHIVFVICAAENSVGKIHKWCVQCIMFLILMVNLSKKNLVVF